MQVSAISDNFYNSDQYWTVSQNKTQNTNNHEQYTTKSNTDYSQIFKDINEWKYFCEKEPIDNNINYIA